MMILAFIIGIIFGVYYAYIAFYEREKYFIISIICSVIWVSLLIYVIFTKNFIIFIFLGGVLTIQILFLIVCVLIVVLYAVYETISRKKEK